MSSEAPTSAELLAAVNVALLALVAKKIVTYTVAGTSYTLADISKLQAFRDQLQREVNQAASGGGVRLASLR